MLTVFPQSAEAVSISNSSLSVGIDNFTGAISSLVYQGVEYYFLGAPVSDYGFQIGSDDTTFGRASYSGLSPNITISSVTSSLASTAVVTGQYNSFIDFTQTYIASAPDLLTTEVELKNNGSGTTTIRYFFAADPDQGIPLGEGFVTINDVFTSSGQKFGSATATGSLPFSVTFGTSSPLGFLSSLGIFSGPDLNNFFTTGGSDPNGAVQDIGFAIGYEFSLNPGEAVQFSYTQEFSSGQSVPEPSTILGLGLLGLGAFCQRKLSQGKKSK
ncbi:MULTISPECIES: PEP-CTERM sorting domain-containing protein [unclassified Microcystis]|jgi:hypothetical protein|uniref:PEP-CTERM sorting domain-containing protein n=1 Tax=unclassified Microcystis TaxID=2643300 RepID=UPI0022C3F73D|nr:MULTISPECIES: PEP-CTERM sorting domain-containing protein [unclassified Microcystis]MCZ8200737.1 PEP-CTERM sorting domain-containing protein [Microcystis sp. LE19-55.1A]MCZ8309093.1 PEP-CTERM sorting domain-containing protein [Microcystis sp. LE19-98.1E]